MAPTRRKPLGLSSFHCVFYRQGETLLQRGCLLGASELGVLAALNCGRVRVFRAATVAVLSTGDELKELGAAPDMARGQIIDSNRPLLCAMLKENWEQSTSK